MMNINEFCSVYSLNKSAVYQKIKRHPELFDGHARKTQFSKILLLDDTAQELLKPSERQQRIKELIRLGEAAENKNLNENYIHRAEINNMQHKIDNLVDKNSALTRKKEELEEENKTLMQKLSDLNQKLSEKDTEIVQLRATIAELEKPKGIFGRLKH